MDNSSKTPSQAITPSVNFYEVTPDDDTDLPSQPKGLYVSEAGTLVVTNGNGDTVTMEVPAGLVLPIRPRRVLEDTDAVVIALA